MGGLLDDYSAQARAYDTTRAASPSLLGPLRTALDGAPGCRLADIGGGTGNYAAALAAEGWEPVVADRSEAMLARARAKGLAAVVAEATALPFADAGFDAAMLVSMLHHVGDRGAALREAWRIVVPGGRVVAIVFTREDIAGFWPLEYFPSSRNWMAETHPPRASLLDELPGGKHVPIALTDIEDGSLAASAARPELFLEPARRAQISYFERLERDNPDELQAGLARLATELEAGRAPAQAGRASLLSWTKPEPTEVPR